MASEAELHIAALPVYERIETIMEDSMPIGGIMHPGACGGLKVLDFSTMMSGPLCSRILGDLGADVIKVETEAGDLIRTVPPHHKGMSSQFAQYNRNKRSIVLDLKSETGRQAARKLASQVDIVIENYRPGVAGRLGISYEDLKPLNPGLIYVSVNGFGNDGPYVKQPAYDHVIQGLVGFMAVQGEEGIPTAIYNSVADKVSGLSGAIATLAAVIHRNATGQGQQVNVKMLDAWASFILPDRLAYDCFLELGPQKLRRWSESYRTYATKDGRVMGLILQDRQFDAFCEALGRSDLRDDPRFRTGVQRAFNAAALYEAVADDLAAMTSTEFLAKMREKEVPFAPVNSIDEFFDDPQVKNNGTWYTVEDPEYGPMRELKFMAEFEATPAGRRHRAPRLGEHTDEVLREFGLTEVKASV